MAECHLSCAVCGAQFTSTQSRAIYCGTECRAEASRQRKRDNRKARKPITSLTYECLWCGKLYHPRRKEANKACSRECGHKVKGLILSARVTRMRVAVSVRRRRCDECDKPYSQRNGKVTCSDECATRRARRVAYEAAKAKHSAEPLDCKECGKGFVAEYGSKRRVFCSDACSRRNFKRAARKRERARLRTSQVEHVNPIAVFDRDGWRCQHCKCKTPRRLRGTYEDRAPEMDHIVPLAKGGEHSYRNVQCLCRACNASKSDGAGGQLRLFG